MMGEEPEKQSAARRGGTGAFYVSAVACQSNQWFQGG
jgi:hypothetical protein